MRLKVRLPDMTSILSDVFDVFYTGKHTTGANAAALKDVSRTRNAFGFKDEVVGMTIYNLTDGSSGTITGITANIITATLAGGTDDDWDVGDEYVIGTRNLNVRATIIGVPPAPASLPPPDGYATIGDGRKTVTAAGTREALVGSATPAKRVEIQAFFSNTSRLAIGSVTVVEAPGTEQGYILLPGSNKTLFVEDLADIYVDVAFAGEGVSFTYFE